MVHVKAGRFPVSRKSEEVVRTDGGELTGDRRDMARNMVYGYGDYGFSYSFT